ncbi:hypothetical protein FIBSPDRAFT_873576 [Athelia psychrophila]|uniref:Uncharacterized protein n=1 Tax=Athelia psychrophila TaxID=1759441 RepID=A0A165YCH8_9AGAM|nr:hypothetical protein FIBSPDRAFT_873576 [Fibularhizoctonia sp. CBS 109695]
MSFPDSSLVPRDSSSEDPPPRRVGKGFARQRYTFNAMAAHVTNRARLVSTRNYMSPSPASTPPSSCARSQSMVSPVLRAHRFRRAHLQPHLGRVRLIKRETLSSWC